MAYFPGQAASFREGKFPICCGGSNLMQVYGNFEAFPLSALFGLVNMLYNLLVHVQHYGWTVFDKPEFI